MKHVDLEKFANGAFSAAVDTDTGEIVGTAGSKVVDLRRREA